MYSRFVLLFFLCVVAATPFYAFGQTGEMRVDMLVTAQTKIPPFYSGHTLPSNGSTITVTALPIRSNTVSPASFRYVWKIDGKTQNGGTPSKSNSFSFTAPLANEVLVSVAIIDYRDKTLATQSQKVTLVAPEIYFYEKNPLQGLIFKSLSSPLTQIADEMTIRAEGYYMSNAIPAQDLLAEWKINQQTVTVGDNPNEITLRRDTMDKNTELSFHMLNLKQLLQGAQKSISIRF